MFNVLLYALIASVVVGGPMVIIYASFEEDGEWGSQKRKTIEVVKFTAVVGLAMAAAFICMALYAKIVY